MHLRKSLSLSYSPLTGHINSNISCKYCGHLVDLSKAKVSGYDSEHSLRHIHCDRCGRIIAWSPGKRSKSNIIQGACGILLGGALAYLLYPYLNFYGLQAGFFTSLYSLFKIIIS